MIDQNEYKSSLETRSFSSVGKRTLYQLEFRTSTNSSKFEICHHCPFIFMLELISFHIISTEIMLRRSDLVFTKPHSSWTVIYWTCIKIFIKIITLYEKEILILISLYRTYKEPFIYNLTKSF